MPRQQEISIMKFQNKENNNLNSKVMKKVKFYAAALASLLMLGACSSSDDLGGGTSESKDGKSYIAVNIKSVGTAGAGSRADYQQGGGTYEDGTENEGAIQKVRFYFFNNDGSTYLLKSSQVNWKEVETSVNGATAEDHLTTIEGKTAALLVIDGETKTAPAYMIAVVNPQTLTNLGTGSYRESQLRDELKDTQFVKISTEDGTKKYSDFVMSNSVYAENGARVCASSVSGHVAESSDDAVKNPVNIYVERVLAKATTNVNTESGWKQIESGEDKGKWEIKVGEININTEDKSDANTETKTEEKRDVYAVVTGWGLADENGKAELEKQIDVTSSNWTSAILGIDPWTSPDYHRCYWSASVKITPTSGTNPSVNHPFKDFTTQFGTTPLYTCPNTPTYEDFKGGVNKKPYENDLTKVLVAAKLVYYDDDNTPHAADICKYRGMQFLGADNVLKQVAKDHNEYWTVDPNDSHKHVLLAPTDLEYTTSNFVTDGSYSADELKSYEVRPVLKAGVKVYVKNADGSFATVDSNDKLNYELAQSPVQVRKEGMTYYYTPIRHLAQSIDDFGYYGVVRNHSYRITINSIQGFGTPVYDPEAVIDPVIPKDTETYLAARINVLSWRVVPSSVDLDATK